MTDGEESHSEDSQGSFQGILHQVLQDYCETNAVPALDFGVMDVGLWENSPALGYNIDSQPISPDSGYLQPRSNGSSMTVNSDLTAGASVPVKDDFQLPNLYEIEPQPLIFSPPLSKYPGQFGFQIHFNRTDHVRKNVNCTYSHLLNKLFVKMNEPCPVKFQFNQPLPENTFIRALLVFTKEQHVCIPVCRCASHIQMDKNPGMSDHVLQFATIGNTLRYEYNNGRYSIVMPCPKFHPDENNFIVLYKFMCLLSCIGGMNRRPVMVIFTLEDEAGKALGRSTVDVKICSSPGRDRTKEEDRHRKTCSSYLVSLPRKRPLVSVNTENENGEFRFIKVRKEHFAIISQINDALNLAALATEEQKDHYRQEERKDELTQLVAKFCKENL